MANQPLPCLILGLVFASSVGAEEHGLPDMAFLEYLGMWDAADEKAWQLFAQDDDELSSEESNRDDGSDPVIEGPVIEGPVMEGQVLESQVLDGELPQEFEDER